MEVKTMTNTAVAPPTRILLLTTSPTGESGLMRYATALAEARRGCITVLQLAGSDKGPVCPPNLMWERPANAVSAVRVTAYRLGSRSDDSIRAFAASAPHNFWLMNGTEDDEETLRWAALAADHGATTAVARQPVRTTIRSVLLTAMDGPDCLEALRIGGDLSRAWGAAGEVVRVVSRETANGGSTVFRKLRRQEYDATQLQLDAAGVRHPIRLLTHDDTASAVIGQSPLHDLLVLGGASVEHLGHLRPGSLSDDISRRAGCPSLTVQLPVRVGRHEVNAGEAADRSARQEVRV